MSSGGIPMFYASDSATTAVREIASYGTQDLARTGTFRMSGPRSRLRCWPTASPHIKYTLTQVVNEFLSWVPTTRIDLIRLRSAQDGEPAHVFFFNRGEVDDLPVIVRGNHRRKPCADFGALWHLRRDDLACLHLRS